MSILSVLGSPVRSMVDVPRAIRERDLELWRRPLEPVTVAWDDEEAAVEVRLPWRFRDSRVTLELGLEGGDRLALSASRSRPRPLQGPQLGRERFASVRVPIRQDEELPHGYHRIELIQPRLEGSGLLIVAPKKCPALDKRGWGVFLPLYAARSRRNWGCGDFTDMGELFSWVEAMGGATVGTLPLMSAFLDRPFEPSPYSPVSRLFWNEVFVDVQQVPDLARSPEAGRLVASATFRREIERVRRTKLVDYRAVATLKRRALEHLSNALFDSPSSRRTEFERFARTRSGLDDYARFRATAEVHGTGWPQWPKPMRGDPSSRDLPPESIRYHQYVQWVAEEQLAASARHGLPGRGLYLDLPVGVNPGGYDTWRFRTAFARGASGGAPPDVFFDKGQDWGFPPPHPEGIRADGYAYFRSVLRHLLRHAGALRVDHVMGLHRLYWIPPGMDATSGAYVRYRPEELYAILALESHRAGAAIVGEDLGTVPLQVRQAMARHGVLRSHVLELEAMIRDEPLPDLVPGSLASLNTHDLPTFAAFWEGTDIDDRVTRGLLDPSGARAERRARNRVRRELATALRRRGLLRGPGAKEAMRAALRHLAASPARMMVANLEDLWLEREPQNRPGTGPEQPNWRRKAARSLVALRSDREIAGTLEEVDRLRGEHDRDRGIT